MKSPGALILVAGAVLAHAACDRPTSPVGPPDAAFSQSASTSETAQLGEAIFFDQNLSIGRNQSCASCHDPAWGFTGPIATTNAHGAVYEGSVPGQFGDRKPPSAAYATVSPILYVGKDGFVGGNFWDGRATGEKLGNPAADQAQGPFLNPKEQALPDAACVVYRVSQASYAPLYDVVYPGNGLSSIAFPPGTDQLCEQENVTVSLSATDRGAVYQEYDRIALAIEAYEASPGVNAFTSKFDAWRGGGTKLSKEEIRGFALFQGKGGCKACHPSTGQEPLFTDFTYDNLGVPSNPENPALLADPSFRDPGLGGFLQGVGYADWMEELGKVKVPTLRNVDRRPFVGADKAYMHNGVFKSLKEVVHFYNTRDLLPECGSGGTMGVDCWPAPEIAQNVNRDELGDLGLTSEEEDAIVAFLKTLSDGFTATRH
jgi:cytochrome c peroxidase